MNKYATLDPNMPPAYYAVDHGESFAVYARLVWIGGRHYRVDLACATSRGTSRVDSGCAPMFVEKDSVAQYGPHRAHIARFVKMLFEPWPSNTWQCKAYANWPGRGLVESYSDGDMHAWCAVDAEIGGEIFGD